MLQLLLLLPPTSPGAAHWCRQHWDWEQRIANTHLLRWFMEDVEVGPSPARLEPPAP
jgi:hypothetical protein